MVVKVFLKEKAEPSDDIRHLRRVLEEIEHEGYRVEYFDPDSRKGKEVAEVYDVYAPSVLLVRENGSEIFSWRGKVPKNPGDLRYFLGEQIHKISPTRVTINLKRPNANQVLTKRTRGSDAQSKSGLTNKFSLKKERTTIKRGKTKP